MSVPSIIKESINELEYITSLIYIYISRLKQHILRTQI